MGRVIESQPGACTGDNSPMAPHALPDTARRGVAARCSGPRSARWQAHIKPSSISTCHPRNHRNRQRRIRRGRIPRQTFPNASRHATSACKPANIAPRPASRRTTSQKMARCIALDRSCADICALAEREMLRNSPFVAAICGVCAIACEACGEECSRHDVDHCQACAAACRQCTEACDQMAEVVANRQP